MAAIERLPARQPTSDDLYDAVVSTLEETAAALTAQVVEQSTRADRLAVELDTLRERASDYFGAIKQLVVNGRYMGLPVKDPWAAIVTVVGAGVDELIADRALRYESSRSHALATDGPGIFGDA